MDTTKRFALLIIGGVLTFLASLALYYFFFLPIEIIKTEPIGGARDTSREITIKVYFNRKAPKILSENVKVVSTPPAEWDISVASNGQSIEIKPQKELLAKTAYTLSIAGKRVTPYNFSFTTEVERFGIGAPEAQEAFETYEKTFPLLKFLPYRTEKYTIMQRQKDEYFVIVFGIYKDETDAIKKDVFAWFKSKGVVPEGVKIDFE